MPAAIPWCIMYVHKVTILVNNFGYSIFSVCDLTAVIARYKVNIYLIHSHGWSSLVVSHPSTGHLLLCACVCNCFVSYLL